MTKIRPFLKWVGGKYNCWQHIRSAIPAGQRLIEPFAGSGAVFMNAEYPSYLLGESNSHLIDLFTTLQKSGPEFIDLCHSYFTPENNTKERYYALRAQFNDSLAQQKNQPSSFI